MNKYTRKLQLEVDLYKEFDNRDRKFKIYCAWTKRLAKKCDCWNCFARFIVENEQTNSLA